MKPHSKAGPEDGKKQLRQRPVIQNQRILRPVLCLDILIAWTNTCLFFFFFKYMSLFPCARLCWLFIIHAPPHQKPLIDAKRQTDLYFIVHPFVLLEFLTKFMYHAFISKETS